MEKKFNLTEELEVHLAREFVLDDIIPIFSTFLDSVELTDEELQDSLKQMYASPDFIRDIFPDVKNEMTFAIQAYKDKLKQEMKKCQLV
jgi:transcription initiation factor IIE alpha subunit